MDGSCFLASRTASKSFFSCFSWQKEKTKGYLHIPMFGETCYPAYVPLELSNACRNCDS